MLQLAAATATLRRAFLYEWTVGPGSVPKRNRLRTRLVRYQTNHRWHWRCHPHHERIDQADATAGSVALGNFTAEPTGAETGISTPSALTNVHPIVG